MGLSTERRRVEEIRGVPRVFESVEMKFGGDLGRAATQQLFGGGLAEPPGTIIIALLNIQIILFPGDITTYHFQGWKTTHSSTIRVHFIDCKGVMILLDHRGSWDPRMTTQFTDRRASETTKDRK